MSNQHKVRRFSTVLALCLATAACGGGADGAAEDDDVIKLGQVLPVNSVQAALAETQMVGAQIAADEINAAGGIDGKMIEIVVKDDKLDVAAWAQ